MIGNLCQQMMAGYCAIYIEFTQRWSGYLESNQDLTLRRRLYYPLYYSPFVCAASIADRIALKNNGDVIYEVLSVLTQANDLRDHGKGALLTCKWFRSSLAYAIKTPLEGQVEEEYELPFV